MHAWNLATEQTAVLFYGKRHPKQVHSSAQAGLVFVFIKTRIFFRKASEATCSPAKQALIQSEVRALKIQ